MKQFLALKASAGSGKTFALTVRYISLLLLDINPTSILTLTFTNKAAAEMSERIFNTLNNLSGDKTILNAISVETNLSIEKILAKKKDIFNKFISSELSIYTLDKFINKILREFSGYIDINDDFLIDNDNEDLMLYKFLISLDSKQFDLLINFSYQQEKKLNSILSLFKVLDEKNVEVKFEDFSASVLEDIIHNIMDSANKIKKFILSSNVSSAGFKAVEFNDVNQLLKKGKTWLTKESLCEFPYFKKAKPPIELDDDLDFIKNNLTLYYIYKQREILNNLFLIFNNFKEFRHDYKKAKNSLEFRDITNLVHELLTKFIDKDFLYFRLDIKYEHILIDEFQDTSVLQYKILEPLIDEIISESNDKYRTFFYVGDTKQSIYRFRGGNKELYDWLANKHKKNLELQILDTNYRSSNNVVNFVNSTFLGLTNYEYFAQKVNSKIEGYVEITSLYLEEDEKYKDLKVKLEELFKAGVSSSNIAILTYTNSDVLELYEYLSVCFPSLKILTELTSKLIKQKNVKALINLIKYFYFNEDIYRYNYNAIVGNDIATPLSVKISFKTNSLMQVVQFLANEYELIENNVIKFIEELNQYKDIVDFIYEIDNNDSVMLTKENSGLQILTVFKAKGLEFDTVIVLDRIKKKNADKSALLFEYEDIDLKNIYYKNASRKSFDETYKTAIENENNLVLSDELNILYVALTRAKNNLIIFKKDKESVFEYLGDSFTNYKYGKLYLNKANHNTSPELEVVIIKKINIKQQVVQKNDALDSVQNIKARYFGIATHYCLEMMKSFDTDSLVECLNIVKTKYSNYLNEEDFEDMYKRIEFLINDDKFMSIIKDKEFSKEQSLVFNDEIKIIDLLIKISEDEYCIFDYKTTIDKHDSHLKQLELYNSAICEIANTKNVKSYLVYLKTNSVELVLV
jgi:exodeoxyribonuclease V beta subunit